MRAITTAPPIPPPKMSFTSEPTSKPATSPPPPPPSSEPEDLTHDAAADSAADGVTRLAEAQILENRTSYGPAGRTRHHLHEQVRHPAFHDFPLPGFGCRTSRHPSLLPFAAVWPGQAPGKRPWTLHGPARATGSELCHPQSMSPPGLVTEKTQPRTAKSSTRAKARKSVFHWRSPCRDLG